MTDHFVYEPQPAPSGASPALTVIRMKDGRLLARHGAAVYRSRVEVDVEKGEVRLVFKTADVDFTTEERLSAGVEARAISGERHPIGEVIPALDGRGITLPSGFAGEPVTNALLEAIGRDVASQIRSALNAAEAAGKAKP